MLLFTWSSIGSKFDTKNMKAKNSFFWEIISGKERQDKTVGFHPL
jgi:hypothetical protein